MEDSAAITALPGRLGAYRVTGLLGRGGMGVVFEAEHETSGQRVALKTVRAPSAAHLGSLRREMKALSRVRHPGVVRIVAEGVHESLPWYAMELLRGPTLADLIGKLWTARMHTELSDQPTVIGALEDTLAHTTVVYPPTAKVADPIAPPPPPVHAAPRVAAFAGAQGRLLTIVRRLCDTLAFLHGEGIVHRDLKPENVFVRDDDTPVLVDFGLAGHGGSAREVLDLQVLAGTPQYISPEQLAGAVVDARADIYAVGCILYECTTGKVPFDASSLAELRERIEHPPALPSALVKGLSITLEDLALRLLAPSANDRVGHAADVSRVLEREGGLPWPREVPPARSYVYRPALTGRQSVLSELGRGLSDLRRGMGGLWLLRGESGIGKTYIAMAAARDASLAGAHAVVCACLPIAPGGAAAGGEAATDAPLRALAPLLRALVDACVERPERSDEILGPRAAILAAHEPDITHLPRFRDLPEPPELPQAAARDRLLGALAESLAALARSRPVLLLVDDMQWADELSVAFVARLGDSFFRHTPVLVLGMYRSDEVTPELTKIAARPDVHVLDVGRLDEPGVAAMVGDMLAHRNVPPSFASFLTARSEGNPFFVVEYVRTAVAEGLLRRTEVGGWRIPELEAGWEKMPLPTSLVELVERRLSALGPDARAVLAAASVIGREVSGDVLARVLDPDLAEDARFAAVRELVLRQVLEDTPGGELRFVHDKLRQVAHESLGAAELRSLHARVGAAIEAVVGEHDGPSAAILAHHFRAAGDEPRATRYLERAGEHALATFAFREGMGFFRELVALSDRALAGPLSPAQRLRRVRWERLLAEAQFGLGDVNGILEHAERALRWAGVSPPSSSRAWALSLARNLPTQIAHRVLPARFVAADETERAIFREASAAMQRLAQRSYFLDANAMVAGSLWSVNLAERAGGAPHVALSYAMLGMVSGIAGLRGPAERYFALSRSSALEHGDASALVEADYAEATWRSGVAEWPEVYRLLERGLARAEDLGDRNQTDIVRTVLANTDFFTGRFAASAARLEDVTTSARADENPQHLAWGLYGAARALVPLGRDGLAAALLEEAALVLAPQAELPSKIICHALLARARLRAGDRSGAIDAARTALARISENRLTAYAIVAAYADAAEVFLALAATFPDAAESARKIARAFTPLALSVPLAAPYRDRVAGLLAEHDATSPSSPTARTGLASLARRVHLARAARAFERALAGARRFGLSYEEARAHLDLARTSEPGSPAARSHHLAAERLLATLGCPLSALSLQPPHKEDS